MKVKIYLILIYVIPIILLLTGCMMVIKNSSFTFDKNKELTTDKTVLINGIRINRHKNIDTVKIDSLEVNDGK